jgi:hypothetical protein
MKSFADMALGVLRSVSPRVLLLSLLQAFGTLWLVVELSSFFSSNFAATTRSYWWLFILVGGVFGVVRAVPRLYLSMRVSGTDTFVEVRVADMFSIDAAYIIGTTRTFDTSIEGGIVSPNSTQGQFFTRFCGGVEDVDAQIAASLTGLPHTVLSAEQKPFGKREFYPVGTVAQVRGAGRLAYLVAFMTLNQHRVTSASVTDVLAALPSTWEYVRTHGDVAPLCCAVLGSAFSRITATREELLREIVSSFARASRAGRFCERLTITISPQDFRDGKVKLRSVQTIVEYECLHRLSG